MTAPDTANCQVVFSPSGRRGSFAAGTTVLRAAQQLGIDLDSVCGGRGLCGRCCVTVTEGEFPRMGMSSPASGLSAMTAEEREFLQRSGSGAGSRLACRAQLHGSVGIDVPPASQVHQQVVRKPFEAHDIDVRPVVRPHFVAVEPPARGDSRGDLERLCDALEREWKIRVATWDLEVARELPRILRAGQWNVTAAIRHGTRLVAAWPGLHERLYGVAVDVGSTTVAAQLCDLANGRVLAEAGCMNPQIRYGEDLMSRISYAMKNADGRTELTRVIREAINGLVTELTAQAGCSPADVLEVAIAGNSVMHHLVLGWDPTELGRAPFTLTSNRSQDVPARELGIAVNAGGHAFVLPCIAGHIGADMAAVLLAEAPWDSDELSLIIDVGTNAEMVVGNRRRLIAASSPTGPAFEGAHVSAGQRAAPGAIERVRIDPRTLEPRLKVIGSDLWSDEPGFAESLTARGITGMCGSGIIEAIAELYLAGVIGSDGRIGEVAAARSDRIVRQDTTHDYQLVRGTPGIAITQADVRAIQLAKAALYAGARLLMERMGIERVDRIRLAGAFGAQIDVRYAMILGMIPDCPLERVSSAGNAAGTGARIALLDRQARELVQERVLGVEKLETTVDERFQHHFVAALSIPHETEPFTELNRVVALPPQASRRRPG